MRSFTAALIHVDYVTRPDRRVEGLDVVLSFFMCHRVFVSVAVHTKSRPDRRVEGLDAAGDSHLSLNWSE